MNSCIICKVETRNVTTKYCKQCLAGNRERQFDNMKLDDSQREAIKEHILKGYSLEATAEIVKVSKTTVVRYKKLCGLKLPSKAKGRPVW